MSTHNICFYEEIEENYPRIIVKYSSLRNSCKNVSIFLVQSLQSKQESLLSRIDTLDRENTELKEQVSTLEEEKDQFEDQLSEEKREVTSLQKKLKDKKVTTVFTLSIWTDLTQIRP